jgi:hypothetical protein
VFDPAFGNRFRDAWHRQAVWIAMSPGNAPTVQALSANASNSTHPTGITVFAYDEIAAAEDQLVSLLSTIDLDHSPYSTTTPYTVLTVTFHMSQLVKLPGSLRVFRSAGFGEPLCDAQDVRYLGVDGLRDRLMYRGRPCRRMSQ